MTALDFGDWACIAAGAGLLIFGCACFAHKVLPPIEKPVEALGFGALIPVGIRMIVAAFKAEMLCHFADQDSGAHQVLPGLTFGEHKWEIVVGGICIVLTSVYSLIWLCKHPAHQDSPAQHPQPNPNE